MERLYPGQLRWLLGLACTGTGFALLPRTAQAAGGDSGAGDTTLVVLALVLVVAAAYLLTHFVVERLQRRFLVLSGFEYIALGVLLGPQVPYQIPAFSEIEQLLPIVALALGWIGLLRGMELSRRGYREKPLPGTGRMVLVQALCAGGLTAVAAYIVFSRGYFFAHEPMNELSGSRSLWMGVGVLGCAAAAGSVAPLEVLERRYRISGDMRERIRRIARLSDPLAILVFGLLFCVLHPYDPDAPVQPNAVQWALISFGLGGLLGILFTTFLGEDDSESGRFLAMVGIIVLASGAAYFLDLSPLLVNLTLGAVLVNSRRGAQIQETLERTKRPMALVLLIFAGALWKPVDPLEGALVCAAYVALRFVGKVIGSAMASWFSPLRRDSYRGLLAHGEVSVAMAISVRLVFEGEAVDLAYTAILVSVIFNDWFAPRALRGLLVDAGDLQSEVKEGAQPKQAEGSA